MNVGFIGTGNMGLPMARNLLRAGHSVAVYNRTQQRARPLEADGARLAESVGAAARGAEAVITMLSDDNAVEQTVFGAGGLLDGLAPGQAHVSMSTISVAMAQRLAEAHTTRQQAYLSAPVFGRPEAAEGAKLWVVAAGEKPVVERCAPLFAAVSRGVTVLDGEPARANLMKLAGNFTIASVIETLGEAFALVRKAGADPHTFLGIINNALFRSPLYENYGGIIADERFEPPGFELRLGLKDARLVLAAADGLSVPMPLASLIRDHMLDAQANGKGALDWAALSSVAAESAGLLRRAS